MKTSPLLEQYRHIVANSLLNDIYNYAQELKNLHILHFNTTKRGGGVSGILNMLLPVMEELGIHQSWEIISLSQENLLFSSKLLAMLQGGEEASISIDEQETYLHDLQKSAKKHQNQHADAYLIHDFQLIPFASLSLSMRPSLWFCHVDVANSHPHALNFIQPFLEAYELCLFNAPASVFKKFMDTQTQVITLGINPFAVKNEPLSVTDGKEILIESGIDVNRPLIVQVSRFGKWKNPWQVIDIYRTVKQSIPTAQVALVGALEAIDDVDALEVLENIKAYAHNDSDIHLLFDPSLIGPRQVNAFQRYANVVLQRSTREGFGLTVTEAMWKEQAVIGTSATGIHLQITHGQNGFIIDDTITCAAYVVKLLQDLDLASYLGKQAHQHVKDHYLLPMMLFDYLKAISRVCQ